MRAIPVIDPADGAARHVSALGLGCSQVGSLGHPASLQNWRALIDRALDLGVTVLDTADIYGQGDSERVIGAAVAGRRDRAFIMTKVGQRFSPTMALLRPFKPVLKPAMAMAGARAAIRGRRAGAMRTDFTPAYLAQAFKSSRARLGMDKVDVLLLHGPPAEVYRDPGVVGVLASFVAEGRAARVGGSCETLEDLEAALAMPGLGAIQLSVELYDNARDAVLEIADRGVLVFLREAVRSRAALSPVAAVSQALQRPGVSSVIVGTSKRDHLEELARLAL